MAVWGQGDPRWVVESREDGHNVNGWHWKEESRQEWSRGRLRELFTGMCMEQGTCTVSVTSLKEMTGEASITVRKGNKRFPMYDLKLTLAWEGKVAAAEGAVPATTVSGSILIEEVISTLEPDECMLSVTVVGAGTAHDQCKRVAEAMRPKVVEVLAVFIQDIHKT